MDTTNGRVGHRYQPGNPGGPGRPTKAMEKAYLDALKQALPPDQVAGLITEALDLARNTNSWRGIVTVLEIALSYGAGKPAQKVITDNGNLETLLAALAADELAISPADVRAMTAANKQE